MCVGEFVFVDIEGCGNVSLFLTEVRSCRDFAGGSQKVLANIGRF